jgi:DMSO/TMAO reductase YedYZ molybdopterin-dependent catalytic subunit
MEAENTLRVDGAVDHPLSLTYADLLAFPDDMQIRDVSQLVPGRRGGAVRLQGILKQARPWPDATHLTLHASRDDFHVSVPLSAVEDTGIVLYQEGGGPVPPARGGPIRFLIPESAMCHTHDLDDCANVKYLDRMELTVGRGRDTRPADEAAHAALHARQQAKI